MNDATAVAVAPSSSAVAERREQFDLSPRSLNEAMQMAELLANSSIVPKDFIGKPGNILVAVQWGAEIGLKPMQAMQSIAVINGKPALWGDAVLGLVLTSPHCKDVIETYEGTGDDLAAVCIAQRHGRKDVTGRFSVKDAKAAGLLGKQGPWTQYRDRMLKMRARSFALRDQFADVLKGMDVIEAVQDIPTADDRPKTPAEIGAAARPAVVESEDRDALIKRLEAKAAEGAEALASEWGTALKKEQRKLVGPQEIERIKALAAKPIEKATYAEIDEAIRKATSLEDLHQAVEKGAHLSAELHGELKEKAELRSQEIGNA